jgi:hypothetical protein
MFVKIKEHVIVNLLHVSEVIILDNGDMRVILDDGETSYDVTGDFEDDLHCALRHWKRAVQRLSVGNF